MKPSELTIEAYPDKIQARLEARNRERARNIPSSINGLARELVFEDLKLWRIGELKVSFKGGDSELHGKIAGVASKWTENGNITFDFGYDENGGSFRSWNSTDRSHIRVGFEEPGYWSLVGVDSTDLSIALPGEITLNLSGFDVSLPSNWQGVVLHEFGHALGFHHEHQTPALECDFDWNKLYEYLGGPPNYWPKWKVDHNLRQLQSGGMIYSAHDKHSIMHYSFPAWMFVTGEDSPCFTTENLELSETDKEMMGDAYPFDEELIAMNDEDRIANLETLIELQSPDSSAREFNRNHLEYYMQFS
ncbi:MAG TPA: hypothetical protein VKZ56_00590 [Membranihabitans sp.]|nr:hypothetical protein [Membranihabitans sp.]